LIEIAIAANERICMPVAELPEVGSVSQARRRSLRRRAFATIVRFLLVLALGALAGGGWYLARRGFGRQWRALVVDELRKHGVEASVRRLTLDPFRGLVAQDVRIYDYKNRENTIAQISRLSLDVNYAALLQHQPFLNAIDVRNAQVTLPLPYGADPKSPRAQIKNLHAHVYFPPEQIYVSQAEGIFCGIGISATGHLIKRNDYKPSKEIAEAEWQARLATLQRIVSEINQFKFQSRPHVQVKFSGDVAQLENARIAGSLDCEQLQRSNYHVRKLAIAAEFSDQTLTVTQCEWRDELGGFAADARWRRSTSDLEFQARSTLNLRGLMEAIGLARFISDFNFFAPPRLDVSGYARLGQGQPQWQALGHAACDRFSYKGIPFLGANAEFSWDGARTLVRDIHLRHQTGELTAQLLDAPHDFRLDLASTIAANALRSLAPADMREFVNEWDWPHATNLLLTIRGQSRDSATWKGDGKLQLDRGRFRTIGFNNASADIHFGNGAVTYENFRVERDEGVATGTMTYDYAHHESRLSNIRSTLRPTEGIYWIDPKLAKALTPYKFRQPPVVTANGVYQFRGGKNTRLEFTVDSPGSMEYGFLGKALTFDHIAAKLLFTDDRMQIADLTASTFSGNVRGNADISLAREDQRYHATIAIERIDFAGLTDLYFKYKTAEGLMNGHFEWNGVGSDARSIDGKGDVEVRNGDVFAIPVFGPLSDLLNKMLPGLGYHVARKATATFKTKDGVIRTTDFHVDGGAFGMVGHGDANFVDDKIDFDVRIDASGAGFVLTPFYKFFEYKGEGSLSHPTWRPRNF
jgi:hypothetical protein